VTGGKRGKSLFSGGASYITAQKKEKAWDIFLRSHCKGEEEKKKEGKKKRRMRKESIILLADREEKKKNLRLGKGEPPVRESVYSSRRRTHRGRGKIQGNATPVVEKEKKKKKKKKGARTSRILFYLRYLRPRGGRGRKKKIKKRKAGPGNCLRRRKKKSRLPDRPGKKKGTAGISEVIRDRRGEKKLKSQPERLVQRERGGGDVSAARSTSSNPKGGEKKGPWMSPPPQERRDESKAAAISVIPEGKKKGKGVPLTHSGPREKKKTATVLGARRPKSSKGRQ